MRFTGEGGQRLDNLVELGLDVGGRGGFVVGVGVAGVGAGDRESEVAFDPGQGQCVGASGC
jgi:hypothetical protein